jgi:hypothetical protein
MRRAEPSAVTPIVVAQAVPSEVQSTVGSVWKASALKRGSRVWPQVWPPLVE